MDRRKNEPVIPQNIYLIKIKKIKLTAYVYYTFKYLCNL